MKRKRAKLVHLLVVILLLLVQFVFSCKGEDIEDNVWIVENGYFQTNDIERAQSVIPFKLILPTYLPDKIDFNSPSCVYGPVNNENLDEVSIIIEYGEGDKTISIEETNSLSIPLPNEELEPKYFDILGISVLREKYRAVSYSSDNIQALSFDWNQDSYTFSVDVYTYDENEGLKIVESMIKQFE